MILKIIEHGNGINKVSYDLTKLTEEELDFAKAMWGKGWNSFMNILPNISPAKILINGQFPYNKLYTEDKQPLVRYFSAGLREIDEISKVHYKHVSGKEIISESPNN